MNKAEAIKHLRDALHVAGLPIPSDSRQTFETDADGKFTAVNRAFSVGYMRSCIKHALKELGEKVE